MVVVQALFLILLARLVVRLYLVLSQLPAVAPDEDIPPLILAERRRVMVVAVVVVVIPIQAALVLMVVMAEIKLVVPPVALVVVAGLVVMALLVLVRILLRVVLEPRVQSPEMEILMVSAVRAATIPGHCLLQRYQVEQIQVMAATVITLIAHLMVAMAALEKYLSGGQIPMREKYQALEALPIHTQADTTF
jgi:hypothetical protein